MSDALLKACEQMIRPIRMPRDRAADLAQFWSAAPVIEVLPGTVLLREGDPGDSILFVMNGSVKVTVKGSSGQDVEAAILQSPMLLGATGVMDGKQRTSTCTVDEAATVLRMRRPVFMAAASRATPEAEAIRQLLLIIMHSQLLRATDQLRDALTSAPA
ncbi:MAG TPA: hypothetical protein DFR83_12650 [Deltaproteobacteria bacterium]|nr:hypothetical protein [Deltaproteobacteria bacterium]